MTHGILTEPSGPAEFFIDDSPVTEAEFTRALAEIRQRGAWWNLFEVLDPRGAFLEGQAANVTSQFGEDGLIVALFERIGVKNEWCFEVGAGDGVTLSNTKVLRDAGWNAVLIEADAGLFRKLLDHQTPWQTLCVHERIGPDSLDRILDLVYGMPHNLDFGVIDIDGQDYHIFAGLTQYRPRALLVEYNQQDAPIPAVGGEGQAGLSAILELGRSRGYVPLARTNVNVLFCAQEVLEAS
jgi:hypothetical protein